MDTRIFVSVSRHCLLFLRNLSIFYLSLYLLILFLSLSIPCKQRRKKQHQGTKTKRQSLPFLSTLSLPLFLALMFLISRPHKHINTPLKKKQRKWVFIRRRRRRFDLLVREKRECGREEEEEEALCTRNIGRKGERKKSLL